MARRQKRRPADRLLALHIGDLVSKLFFLALLLSIALMLRSTQSYPHYTPHAASLWLAVLIGGVWITRAGMQMRGDVRAAATWPARQLGLALTGSVLLLGIAVVWADHAAQANARQISAESWAKYHELLGPMPADTDNAAVFYRAAQRQITDAFAQFDTRLESAAATQEAEQPQEPVKPPLHAEDLIIDHKRAGTPEFRALVTSLEPAVLHLRQASTLPKGRFLAYAAMPSWLEEDPDLRNMRRSAHVLAAHAIVAAQRGDFPAAAQDVATMRHLAIHASQTRPCLIASLVEIGIDALADATLVESLPHASDLKSLSGLTREERTIIAALRQGIIGEELIGSNSMAGVGQGRWPTASAGSSQNTASLVIMGRFYALLFLQHDITVWHQIAEDAVVGAGTPDRHMDTGQMPGSLLLKMMTPSIDRVITSTGRRRALADARCTDLAVALTRYRLEHGTYPPTLDALVSTFLSTIPADPFDGAPLRYHLTPDAAIIYSIGPDRVDDGGDIDNTDSHHPKDCGVRLTYPLK